MFKPRRKLIVNREVQYDVLMYVGMFVISIFIMQSLATYLFISRVEDVITNLSAQEFVARYKISFLIYQLIPVCVGMVFGAFIFNRLTNHIAGPLYNMKRVLSNVTEVKSESPWKLNCAKTIISRTKSKTLTIFLKSARNKRYFGEVGV